MPGLLIHDLTVRIGHACIVDRFALTAPPSSVTALVGPNGAGKSTVLRAIVGAAPPAGGSIVFDGCDLTALPAKARARQVALLEQQASAGHDLRVSDVVALGRIPHQGVWSAASPIDRQVVGDALRQAGADDLAGQSYRHLSGGQQQRVRLAAALAQQPRLLLVDEPTNHLDISAQLETLTLLRRLADSGLTVLVAIHDLGHAMTYADRVVAMSAGSDVAHGEPGDVLTPDLIDRLYGVRADILTHPVTGEPILTYRRGTHDAAAAFGHDGSVEDRPAAAGAARSPGR